jgi:hypothetical protein
LITTYAGPFQGQPQQQFGLGRVGADIDRLIALQDEKIAIPSGAPQLMELVGR